mmetsp:Transcript_38243/g.120425  ORF Transcript_38243/g.120425 Transcript_38243/m.120425 type:complete len:207 (-) Transcript_38243:255-875(-)
MGFGNNVDLAKTVFLVAHERLRQRTRNQDARLGLREIHHPCPPEDSSYSPYSAPMADLNLQVGGWLWVVEPSLQSGDLLQQLVSRHRELHQLVLQSFLPLLSLNPELPLLAQLLQCPIFFCRVHCNQVASIYSPDVSTLCCMVTSGTMLPLRQPFLDTARSEQMAASQAHNSMFSRVCPLLETNHAGVVPFRLLSLLPLSFQVAVR